MAEAQHRFAACAAGALPRVAERTSSQAEDKIRPRIRVREFMLRFRRLSGRWWAGQHAVAESVFVDVAGGGAAPAHRSDGHAAQQPVGTRTRGAGGADGSDRSGLLGHRRRADRRGQLATSAGAPRASPPGPPARHRPRPRPHGPRRRPGCPDPGSRTAGSGTTHHRRRPCYHRDQRSTAGRSRS